MSSFVRRVFPWVVALVSAACANDDNSCANEVRLAASVTVSAPDGVTVDKVTIEQTSEEACTTVRFPDGSKLYQCDEQHGGGTYVVRVYSGGRVWAANAQVESDGCHVKKYVELTFDLSMGP